MCGLMCGLMCGHNAFGGMNLKELSPEEYLIIVVEGLEVRVK